MSSYMLIFRISNYVNAYIFCNFDKSLLLIFIKLEFVIIIRFYLKLKPYISEI